MASSLRNRQSERFKRRLETEFTVGDKTYRGFSGDFSEKGLFIHTRDAYQEGSILDLVVYLPDGKPARLKGIVRRSIRTNSALVKNGMGVELTERDTAYMNFINELTGADFAFLKCAGCGTTNKVLKAKLPVGPRCGNCKEPLKVELSAADFIYMRCTGCGTTNKVLKARLSMGPRCGNCKVVLKTA